MRPDVYIDFTNSLLVQFGPKKGPIMWTPLLLVLGTWIPFPPGEILQPTRHEIQQASYILYTLGLNSTGVHCICNCILHRSCSILRFFLCMWLAFMLMLTIFHHSKSKTFCLASFLALTKKNACEVVSFIFFLARKLGKQKFFALEWWKLINISTKASHTQGKFQDGAISVKDAMITFIGLNLCSAHCNAFLTNFSE